jgi:hypothetical protein
VAREGLGTTGPHAHVSQQTEAAMIPSSTLTHRCLCCLRCHRFPHFRSIEGEAPLPKTASRVWTHQNWARTTKMSRPHQTHSHGTDTKPLFLLSHQHVMNAKTICPTTEVQRTTVEQTALPYRGSAAALPISFCHTIDHSRTILYYSVLFQDLASRRRTVGSSYYYSGPAASPGPEILTKRRNCPHHNSWIARWDCITEHNIGRQRNQYAICARERSETSLCREQAVGAFDELGVWLCGCVSQPLPCRGHRCSLSIILSSVLTCARTNCQAADHRLNECHCGGPEPDCPGRDSDKDALSW